MLIFSTSPSPMGGKFNFENACKNYPYLGAKVCEGFPIPDYYQNFAEGKLTNEEHLNKVKEIC